MEPEFIGNRLFKLSIKEKMDFLIIIEEPLVGILFLFKLTLLADSYFLSILLDILAILELQYGQTEIKISSL